MVCPNCGDTGWMCAGSAPNEDRSNMYRCNCMGDYTERAKPDPHSAIERALDFAILVIESYAMDIRSLELPAGYTIECGMEGNKVVKKQYLDRVMTSNEPVTADQVGFCQGRIYTKAVETIRGIASNA